MKITEVDTTRKDTQPRLHGGYLGMDWRVTDADV
jgi:hypothetical protein